MSPSPGALQWELGPPVWPLQQELECRPQCVSDCIWPTEAAVCIAIWGWESIYVFSPACFAWSDTAWRWKWMKVKMLRRNEDAVCTILKCDVCLLAAQWMLDQFCYTSSSSVGAVVQKLWVLTLKHWHFSRGMNELSILIYRVREAMTSHVY